MEQAQNPPSTPSHNPSIIDLTTHNTQFSSASYQTLPYLKYQSTSATSPKNTINQICLPPQKQNVYNPQISLNHQQKHTNTQTFPQNYRISQNAQCPSIDPPLPRQSIHIIPIPNERDTNGSELDHCEERERQWRSKEEAANLDIKEEI